MHPVVRFIFLASGSIELGHFRCTIPNDFHGKRHLDQIDSEFRFQITKLSSIMQLEWRRAQLGTLARKWTVEVWYRVQNFFNKSFDFRLSLNEKLSVSGKEDKVQEQTARSEVAIIWLCFWCEPCSAPDLSRTPKDLSSSDAKRSLAYNLALYWNSLMAS